MKLRLYFELYIESTVYCLYRNPLEGSLSLNRRLARQSALWPSDYGNSTDWLLILLVGDCGPGAGCCSLQRVIGISMSGCQVYGYSGLC